MGIDVSGSRNRCLVRPQPRPAARRTLVCLGYSGAGTSAYRGWARLLPPDVELAVFCYPGREGRFSEPFATDWTALREEITSAVADQVTGPFALFGHSMGAGMAFEVAAALERSGSAAPEALVVSGSLAPTDWAAKEDQSPSARQSDEELVEWMSTVGQLPPELREEPELLEMAVDSLRADLVVEAGYRYVPGTTVRADTQVLYGAQDGPLAAEQADRWARLASGEVTVDELPGGHFYTPDVWSRLPERLVWPSRHRS